jgi:hypothetical protein
LIPGGKLCHGHLPDIHICWPGNAWLPLSQRKGHARGTRLPAVGRGLFYSSPSGPFCPKPQRSVGVAAPRRGGQASFRAV